MDRRAASFLEEISRPRAQEIEISGQRLRPGDRVLLQPRPGFDILDLALKGRPAVIERIEEDDCGIVKVAVTLEDDPGRDLAAARHPAHRFLFTPDELEPLEKDIARKRVLVAGIGNIFFGDDGFGPFVVRALGSRTLPRGVEIADYGIRGLDLAYALGQPYDAAILVDLIPPDGCPGRLRLIEPDLGGGGNPALASNHLLDPVSVLMLARNLGPLPPKIYLIGCEPFEVPENDSSPLALSTPVAAAVEQAAEKVIDLARLLLAGRTPEFGKKGVLE